MQLHAPLINETNRIFRNQIKEGEPVKYPLVEGYEAVAAQKHKNKQFFVCFFKEENGLELWRQK